jgi:hypothetical protein
MSPVAGVTAQPTPEATVSSSTPPGLTQTTSVASANGPDEGVGGRAADADVVGVGRRGVDVDRLDVAEGERRAQRVGEDAGQVEVLGRRGRQRPLVGEQLVGLAGGGAGR